MTKPLSLNRRSSPPPPTTPPMTRTTMPPPPTTPPMPPTPTTPPTTMPPTTPPTTKTPALRSALLPALLSALLLSSACATPPPATPSTPSPPRHGATHPAANDAGFEAYDAASGQWLAPDAFLAADKAARPPNRWPDSDAFPPFAATQPHDGLLLLTPDGPCEMYFFHTRWRRRADVRAFGDELRSYKACGTVFTRKIPFADAATPVAPPAAP